MKNYSETRINKMKAYVVTQRGKMEYQYYELKEFAATFNHEFVTEHNALFDTSLRFLKKMSSGLSATKKLFLQGCPLLSRFERRRLQNRNQKLSAFDKSYLSSTVAYIPDLFKMDSYPDFVKSYFCELVLFFDLMAKSIKLCLDTLHDEKCIRDCYPRLKAVYDEFVQKVLERSKSYIPLFNSAFFESLKKNNRLFKIYDESNADDGIYMKQAFHNGTIEEAEGVVLIQRYMQNQKDNITDYESKTFGSDVNRIKRIRFLIANFDKLLPASYKRSSIDSETLYLFYDTYAANSTVPDFLNYFFPIYTAAGGSHKPVKDSAISNAKVKFLKSSDRDDIFKSFKDRVGKLQDAEKRDKTIANIG